MSQCKTCGVNKEATLESIKRIQAENAAMKEQVAQLQAIISEEAKDSGNVILELTTLQSKSAALVDALEAYPDFGEYFMENLEATDMKKAALAEFKGAK